MKGASAEECFFGAVVVGERGQVVIPAEIRRLLHIAPGERLLVFRDRGGLRIVLSRIGDAEDVLDVMKRAEPDRRPEPAPPGTPTQEDED
ncbi:MAG TPA: AbrB/MazE/SpoVT family DNA-binding domain-containing protein [Armatimonadota bacterium]|jgi:AbrB family looped-hinge helix DNA binding protein